MLLRRFLFLLSSVVLFSTWMRYLRRGLCELKCWLEYVANYGIYTARNRLLTAMTGTFRATPTASRRRSAISSTTTPAPLNQPANPSSSSTYDRHLRRLAQPRELYDGDAIRGGRPREVMFARLRDSRRRWPGSKPYLFWYSGMKGNS